MDELDMSRPGSELFPESSLQNYNSYMDVNTDQSVGDPLDTGAMQDVAGQPEETAQQQNFRALRAEVAKFKEEMNYWKGQAEAYSRQPAKEEPAKPAFDSFDWDDGQDVRKAFDALHQENQRIRDEMRDQLASIQAQSKYQDWNNVVSQHVPQLTNKNPIFAEMIQKASNPYEAAYLLAELNAKASHQVATPPNGNAQRVMSNMQKPQTLSSIGGQGQLSSADYYASMSDDDFMKIASKNLANV